jgi:hypothetical protein
MTEPTDPPRLLDSPGSTPQGLRDALDSARSDVGSEQQLARLAQRLGPLLAPPVAPAPPAAIGGALKLGLLGVALIIAGGGAWLLTSSKSAPPSAPVSAPVAPAAPLPPSSPEPAAPATEAPQPAPPNSELGVERPAKPVPPAQPSEAELLEQARSALKSDASRALARANEHRSRFPGGVLVQEREVIAIKALRQLGRTAEADRRAEAFEKAFPGSAFQRKLKPSP